MSRDKISRDAWISGACVALLFIAVALLVFATLDHSDRQKRPTPQDVRNGIPQHSSSSTLDHIPNWRVNPNDDGTTPIGDDNHDGVIDEDESGWNCATMGNKVCG